MPTHTSPSNSSQHHTPRFKHHTPRFYIICHAPSTQHPSSSLQRHPIKQTALASKRAPCGHNNLHGMDGERRGFPRGTPAKAVHGARTARFPAKRDQRERRFCGPEDSRKLGHRVRQARLWERPPVTLTSRRRVRSPDWQRERRHAQKGRGAENEAGPRLTRRACCRDIERELLEREKRGRRTQPVLSWLEKGAS